MTIQGLNNKAFEFYHDNNQVFLIHDGKNIAWNNIPATVLEKIKQAFDLPKHRVIRKHIESYLNNYSQKLMEFCRIVWGQLDHNPDISENGEFNFENVADYHLSNREIEFIKLVCLDLTDKEIADKMGISYYTATTYSQNLRVKTGQNTKVGLALWAFKNGLV